MHLGMFLQGAGHHVAGWRYPGAESGSENIPHLLRQAVTAERAKFDMVFLADGLTSSEDGHPSQIARFEPLMVLTAFALATSRIGLAPPPRRPTASRFILRAPSPRSITSATAAPPGTR